MMVRKFIKDERGAVAVETAFIMTILLTLALGILDFGLLMARKMEVTNAVRAGIQYAMVRKPEFDALNPGYDAYEDIKQATLAGLIPNTRATNIAVEAELICSCGDTESACFGIDANPDNDPGTGTDLSCVDEDGVRRSGYLTIRLEETYSYIFGFVGGSNTITITDSAKVRVN